MIAYIISQDQKKPLGREESPFGDLSESVPYKGNRVVPARYTATTNIVSSTVPSSTRNTARKWHYSLMRVNDQPVYLSPLEFGDSHYLHLRPQCDLILPCSIVQIYNIKKLVAYGGGRRLGGGHVVSQWQNICGGRVTSPAIRHYVVVSKLNVDFLSSFSAFDHMDTYLHNNHISLDNKHTQETIQKIYPY